jgi:hypothetical protein
MSNTSATNPLAKHFRQPAIYLRLPSGGKFYPNGALDLSLNGEIPIYPMTIKDEVLLKTPDALMNGSGMADMIRSCCPNIKDVWNIPLVDLDAILIAIRLASYGADMDVSSSCTHCKEDNEHTLDLRAVLDNLTPIKKYSEATDLNGLKFKLKPQTYKDLNRMGLVTFEQEKLIGAITDSELPEEQKKQQFQEAFDRLTALNVESVVSCIESIITEDGTVVSDPEMIAEFLTQTDRKTYDTVKDMVQETVGANSLEPVEFTCGSCKENYKVKVEFNQSSFFG